MANAPNQATGQGSVPVRGKVKPAAKKTPPAKTGGSSAGKYNWGDGARHSIPLSQHRDNVTAQKTLGTNDLTAPPTGAQAIREANANADLQYGPQVNTARQLNANVAPWFADHLARVAGYARAAQQQMQPTLDQAQALANPATAAQTQAAPGLDPNSEAGKAAGLAAQGRAALAALGSQALGANAQSTQDTFAGMGALASREQPQAQAAAAQGLANAESQRGQAVTGFLTTARQNAQNYAIARGTLGANIANSQADAATAAANTAESVRHHTASETSTTQARKDAAAAKGQTVNKYGFTANQWDRFSPSHRQRIMAEQGANTGANTKTAQKHAEAITKASGDVQNTVTDIIGKYKSYIGKQTDDTSKPILKNGQPVKGPDGKPTYEARKLTDTEIRTILGQNKSYTPQLIHIAVLRNQGKPLDQESIDYLHNLNQNFRIPRDWLPKQGSGPQGSGGNAPSNTPGQSRPT